LGEQWPGNPARQHFLRGSGGAPMRVVENVRRARDTGGPGPAKGMAPSYVSRALQLTLLAPEIVEAILDGRQPTELRLDDLLNGFPLDWDGQCKFLAINDPSTRAI
jgi:hypothetical protein